MAIRNAHAMTRDMENAVAFFSFNMCPYNRVWVRIREGHTDKEYREKELALASTINLK
jgi:hypothetical protein